MKILHNGLCSSAYETISFQHGKMINSTKHQFGANLNDLSAIHARSKICKSENLCDHSNVKWLEAT